LRASSRNGQLAALATVALWCASFALIKHLVDAGLGAQDVAAGRFIVAWPGFLYLLWRAGGLPGLTRSEALRILLASAGGVTAYHLALNEGERTTASGVAALIVALAPAATLALSLAVGLERYAPRRIAGIALAFSGVVVVVLLGSGAHFSLHGLRGPLLVLVAPLTFAVYNVLYKPLLGRYDLPALTAAGGLTGSFLFLPFENTGAIDVVMLVKGACQATTSFQMIDPEIGGRQLDLVRAALSAPAATRPLRGRTPSFEDLERAFPSSEPAAARRVRSAPG